MAGTHSQTSKRIEQEKRLEDSQDAVQARAQRIAVTQERHTK